MGIPFNPKILRTCTCCRVGKYGKERYLSDSTPLAEFTPPRDRKFTAFPPIQHVIRLSVVTAYDNYTIILPEYVLEPEFCVLLLQNNPPVESLSFGNGNVSTTSRSMPCSCVIVTIRVYRDKYSAKTMSDASRTRGESPSIMMFMK